MKQAIYILVALVGLGLARVSLAERNAPVTFTMQPLEPGQMDDRVRFQPGAGGKWSGSCEGVVEETWSGISYYSPSNCSGDYQTRASSVGARPGFRFDKFFLFRSLINNRQMNIMSSSGNCPSSSQTYNFLLLRGRNKDDYESTAFPKMDYSQNTTFSGGTFTYDSSDITGVSRFSLQSLSPVSNSANAFSYMPVSTSCASGVLTQKSSDFTDMPLGKYPSWVFGDFLAVSVEGGTNPIMTVAVPQSALSTASSFWADKNKNVYTGLMTHFTKRGEQEQKNIYLTPSDENGRVFSLSEASGTGALNDTRLRASLGSINCSTLNSPSAGFCSGTLAFTGSANTGKAVCLFSFSNNGKDLLFCAAQSPLDNSRLITFLAGTSAVTKLEVQASPLHLTANQSSGTVNITVTNLTSRPALSLNPDALGAGERLSAPFSAISNSNLTGSFINPGGFVTGNTCGTYLPAYSTCQIQIAYAPSTPRLDKQTFRLPYEKSSSTLVNATTPLLGSRGLSSLTVTAPSLSVGGTSQAQVIANFSNGETQDVSA
ncbi:MAG: hypothetical protein EBQ92_01320, partial [Proteobacteria bacterium]|nr:hypothetical protein [Pseudomonadota bacterium]